MDILEHLVKDTVDFVRQGALIALGMVLVQQNEQMCPRAKQVRESFATIIADKREEALARIGATFAQGIIDCGGRNVTISLQNQSGFPDIPSIVGMALFTQFWQWFPLAHFLSLSFSPTPIIAINESLEPIKFSIKSNGKPSLYAYQPQTQPPQTETLQKVATAVLSTTLKTQSRKKKDVNAMDIVIFLKLIIRMNLFHPSLNPFLVYLPRSAKIRLKFLQIFRGY